MPATIYVKRAHNSESEVVGARSAPYQVEKARGVAGGSIGARNAYCQEMRSVLSPLFLILTTPIPCLLAW
jgi:hypothetical protein